MKPLLSQWRGRLLLCCLVLTALGSATHGHAQWAEAPDLIAPASSDSIPDPSGGSGFPVQQHRLVQPDSRVLAGIADDRLQRVHLPLFPNRDYVGHITTVESRIPFLSFRGELEGLVNGTFSAVYQNGNLLMHVSDGRHAHFELAPSLEGGHALTETPSGVLGTCGTEMPQGPQLATLTDPGAPPRHPVTTVDILILYTTNVRLSSVTDLPIIGHVDSLNPYIQSLIADSNWRHGRSDTRVYLRLVDAQEIAFDDSSQDLSSHLTKMGDPSVPGSINAEVTRRREAAGADLVCMLTLGRANSGSTLGIGSVGDWDCVVAFGVDTSVFTHEIGHNLACRHEIGAPDGTPSSGYNHGFAHTEKWSFLLFDQTEKRVTIMNSTFNPATRTDYFSNPSINFTWTGGDECGGLCANVTLPLGIADHADNARFLRETRANTARWIEPKLFLNSSVPAGGNATKLNPEKSLANIYSTWIPSTEADPDKPADVRLAAGAYPSITRIDVKTRLTKWGDGNPARITR